MKLHFEPDLDFQREAIEAVCDLFRGQEVNRTEFTVTAKALGGQQMLGFVETERGVGNRLTLHDDEILKNLQAVQVRSGLRPSTTLTSGDFTVEMETGTGKTYVYLRTIFELNRRYGFTKFVVVVPSVAIKEGVYKSLQITHDHFRGLYAGVPYDYFLYDSSNLGQVRSFATSAKVQIMVMTVGAINKKDVNNLYKDNEKMGGEKPIDLIQATHPIVIVDEPQSVDGGLSGKGKEALAAMNPMCTLRYSATHADKHHMVYRLDAVDAYNRKLVKQIEVASATIEHANNTPYVRLIETKSTRGTIEAVVELNVAGAGAGGKVQRKTVRVQAGHDLQQETGLALYEGYHVGDIRTGSNTWMELRQPGSDTHLTPGDSVGGVSPDALAREMIKRTIRAHLDKERRLRPLGIKVLSLFFVERVSQYREYDADGQPLQGPYAKIFEEEYRRLAGSPDYQDLFKDIDLSAEASEVHDGYFSMDKKRRFTEPELGRDGDFKNESSRADAERAYNLIMREKERLLSMGTPLKFIFSHSALREGWDNPNVFQICTLRDMSSERQRRQTIGRGLRLCVNQEGQRVRGFDVNTLTVVATESFESFAEKLQKEIEEDTGIRFGVVEKHQFAAITVLDTHGQEDALGIKASEEIWDHLVLRGYVDAKGKVTDLLRVALKGGKVDLPPQRERQHDAIVELLTKLAGGLAVKNADERKTVRARQAVLESPEFKALWERIRHKTTYRVSFDPDKLIRDAARALQNGPPIPNTRLHWRLTGLAMGMGGLAGVEKPGASMVPISEGPIDLPDLLTELQDRTQLTRRSIVAILTESGRLGDFRRNPQQFIEIAGEVINRTKRAALIDGIVYRPVGDGAYYAQELFVDNELSGYLVNMLEDTSGKSVYEHVVHDSGTERSFAQELQNSTAVKVFAKLPGWFTVPTPLGSYNPDWAIVLDEDGEDRVYLIVETKSTLFQDEYRDRETAKIEAATRHFKALTAAEPPARYIVAPDLTTVQDRLLQE